MIKSKRTYDAIGDDDGYRILIDRLWPRGLSTEKAHIDLWMKDIAPSTELRKWYDHDTTRWHEFKTKYIEELTHNKHLVKQIHDIEKEYKTVTLLYSAKDTEHANIKVLMEILRKEE